MQAPKLLVTTLALAASIALGATALAATQDEFPQAPAVARDTASNPSGEVVEPDEGPGTDVAPAREVAEPDEGPGTDTPPVREGGEYEGPGTDIVPPGTTAQYDCRVIDDREVCDTFDEADEGPGTR